MAGLSKIAVIKVYKKAIILIKIISPIFRISLIFLTCLFNFFIIKAQNIKQIEIINADAIEFNKYSGTNARKLTGNVQFKYENTLMYCDSAYFYTEKNMLDAYSNVRINQGDTLQLNGDQLMFDGNKKIAQVRKKIRLRDRETILTTDYLDFYINENYGYYIGGGKIINGSNTLTSDIGYYYTQEKFFYFRKNVVIINPDYTIKSDTLKYNIVSKTAYFLGPTNITSKDNYIYCENGWYNTSTNISQFNKNAYLKLNKQLIKSDSLYYERNTGTGKAFRNIWMIDSAQNIIITGNYAWYREKPQYAIISDSVVLMQYTNDDTMYIHSDTIKSIADSANKERTIRAYFHTKIFKNNLQGKCDSLTYTTADSTIRLFIKPVLWSDENQITSEYIELQMANNKLNTAHFYNNSFIISKEDTGKFNQIKGRKMTGYFKDNELNQVFVSGNGQTVYYAKDSSGIIGINKAESSDLKIYLENRKVKRIVFLTQPNATLYPPEKAPMEEQKLHGFKWYEKSRPLSKNDIFLWQDE